MSLRLRLVLLVLGLTIALLGGLGLAVAGSLRSWTQEVVDAELSRRAEVLAHEVQYEDGALEFDEDDLGERNLPFRIETETGALLLVSDAPWPAGSPGGLGFAGVKDRTGEPVRALSIAFTPRGATERLVLRVAAPLGALSGLADRFRGGLLLALLLAMALGAGGAAVLAHLFLAPLRRLSRSVDEVEARSLTSRLDTAGLDPELRRLATAFNDLLSRVAAVVESQRDFVGRASHALRTPLSSILVQAEVALRRERSADDYRAALETIGAAARDAARLTDGLLALTRADASLAVAEQEEVTLTQLAAELERLFRPRAEAAGLRFETDIPEGLVVRATKDRVRELLDALLDNAVRYTPAGGTVRFAARAEGAAVLLEVLDSGLGISPEEKAKVFERFFRGSAATRSGQPGSGLGLAMVKAIADAEGAEISLADAPGAGTGTKVVLTFGRSRANRPSGNS